MANSPKYRDFFITINQEAKSYENVLEIVKELNYKLYAFIVHDKDELIDKETGEHKGHKQTHKHLMLELKNPVSFNGMQNRFAGAHIDIPKYKKSAYQYLIHNSPRSKGEKYEYSLEDIITNDKALVKHIIETETNELFIETKFLVYMIEGVRTPYQFAKRFGLNAYKQYWHAFNDMLMQVKNDEDMQNDIAKLQKEQLKDDLPF